MDQLCINTIRTLSMDAVQNAGSGHPGTPMALAPVVYSLWQHIAAAPAQRRGFGLEAQGRHTKRTERGMLRKQELSHQSACHRDRGNMILGGLAHGTYRNNRFVLAEGPRPDVVISDYMMPVLDGAGLIPAMRESEAQRDIPSLSCVPRARRT